MDCSGSDDVFSGIRMLLFEIFIQVMNRIHYPGCCIDCIDSFLCFTPVAGFSMDVDLHTVDHGRRLPLMNRHPKSHIRCIMKHEKCIRFRILQSSCLEHPSGTFSDFFCRFKKEANPYRKSFFFLPRFIFLLSFAAFLFLILFLCYDLREDQCCRQNKIMSAGMHISLIHGFIWQSCLLLYRQGIHLRPENHQFLSVLQTGKFCDQPGRFHRSDLIAQLLQISADICRSFHFLKCQLRMLVKMVSQTDQFLCVISYIHISSHLYFQLFSYAQATKRIDCEYPTD